MLGDSRNVPVRMRLGWSRLILMRMRIVRLGIMMRSDSACSPVRDGGLRLFGYYVIFWVFWIFD